MEAFMRYKIAIAMTIALSTSTLARADSCLDDVSNFAVKICGEIQTSGSSSKTEISGELKAELSGIVRKVLGNAKAGTDGKHIAEAYENVLRNDLPAELKDVRSCRLKMVKVGRSELCKPEVTQVPNKRYTSDPQENIPGVAISYPGTWIEKEAGTGVPRILPPLNSKEDKAGLEIEITVSSAYRAGVEEWAGIKLSTDEPRDPETLTSAEHLNFIKNSTIQIHGEEPDFNWMSQHPVSIPVFSDTENPPESKTSDEGWIVDYIVEDRHFKELHFFQPSSEWQAPAETFGTITITCVAPKLNFESVEDACKKILNETVAISRNYFGD